MITLAEAAKTYRGIRDPRDWSRKIVVIDLFNEDGRFLGTRALRHIERHSPDGFEWGYGGSGPADLALSILADSHGMEIANRFYQDFKFKFVAKFARNEWEASSQEIDAWLEKQKALCG